MVIICALFVRLKANTWSYSLTAHNFASLDANDNKYRVNSFHLLIKMIPLISKKNKTFPFYCTRNECFPIWRIWNNNKESKPIFMVAMNFSHKVCKITGLEHSVHDFEEYTVAFGGCTVTRQGPNCTWYKNILVPEHEISYAKMHT